MKSAIMVLLLHSLLLASCSTSAPQEQVGSRQDSLVYIVDIAQSKIEFVSIKDGSPVRCFVGLRDGQLVFKSGVLMSANLILDMNTLAADGKDSSDKANETARLMDSSCFAVAKYPMVHFALISALPNQTSSLKGLLTNDNTHQIEGDLMMKGINKRIAFPAKLFLHHRTLTMDAYPQLRLHNWLIAGMSNQESLTPISMHLVAFRQ
jgi:hypothetical protein